jgi:hypothetical protein
MIRKGARLCPLSDPRTPHYFRPLFRNQVACCIARPATPLTFWQSWQEEQKSAQAEKQEKSNATQKL